MLVSLSCRCLIKIPNSMELFTFIPYFLLLEREESDRNTLANANTEFICEVYELQRVEKDVTLVFFQLQYLSCKLVILREHYRTAQKEHLPCYAYIIGTLEYLKGLLDRCRFIHKSGSAIAPAGLPTTEGDPPVCWTAEVICLMELLYACHELKMFNGGEVTLGRVVEYVCHVLGVNVKNASSYYARMRRRKAGDRTYFIDRLREVLLKRMEDDDEGHRRRNR